MSYDAEVAALTEAYKQAVTRILAELNRIDLTDISRANSAAALTEVSRILTDLNAESAAWVAENIPKAAMTGVTSALTEIGVDSIARFSRINSEMVKAVVADTQADLLAVTQNVERRVRTAVRQVTADSMRANMSAGINGSRTMNRDILAGLRKTLGDSVITGIIDASGRRWRPEVYVNMVTGTKMMRAQIDATINEAVSRDVLYGQISRHGATDACAKWEGKYVKLVPDAPGNLPYIGDLPRREIFHPKCKHVISPIRVPPTDV